MYWKSNDIVQPTHRWLHQDMQQFLPGLANRCQRIGPWHLDVIHPQHAYDITRSQRCGHALVNIIIRSGFLDGNSRCYCSCTICSTNCCNRWHRHLRRWRKRNTRQLEGSTSRSVCFKFTSHRAEDNIAAFYISSVNDFKRPSTGLSNGPDLVGI